MTEIRSSAGTGEQRHPAAQHSAFYRQRCFALCRFAHHHLGAIESREDRGPAEFLCQPLQARTRDFGYPGFVAKTIPQRPPPAGRANLPATSSSPDITQTFQRLEHAKRGRPRQARRLRNPLARSKGKKIFLALEGEG